MSAVTPIDQAVSERICSHMNKDHSDALLAFAKHYGEAKNPVVARMLTITPNNMELEVDGVPMTIPFTHRLSDSSDAHQPLVEMVRSIKRNEE